MRDERALRAYMQSALRNTNREMQCTLIQGGFPLELAPDTEGWYTVSFHVAGSRSALVQQSKLRKRYTGLETKVCKQDDEAVIKVKRRV